MAETKQTEGNAEKAYAEAASELKPATSAPKAQPAKRAPAKAKAKPVTAASKAPAKRSKPAPAKKTPVKKPVAAKKAPAKRAATPPKTPTVTELKEKIMATKTSDMTEMMSKTMTDAVAEMQTKAQEAYDKTTGMVTEMTDVAKANVEAVVESGKIMAAGMQDFGKSCAEEAKSAYETMTADLKEMAAVKSPTELFQLQGKIVRRNFDAMVATSSKNSEAAMKLANDVIAPISTRVNVTVEKLSKVA